FGRCVGHRGPGRHRRPCTRGRGGRDRWQGAVRGPIHPARGPGRGALTRTADRRQPRMAADPNADPSAPPELHDLLAVAGEVLDGAAERFVHGIGAPSAVAKGGNDFATEFDLELERTVSAALRERTGIEVHGEEFGGPQLTSGTAWVLDPIDGTFNYSAGHPLSAILLALVHDGEPVVGLTWLP